MDKDYLSYWTPKTVEQQPKPIVLDHAASEQYYRLERGDTVWIVTMKEKKLRLLGKIRVDAILSQKEAERRLGTDDLWEASYHIFPAAGDDTRSSDLNISDYAERLRFASVNDRLILNDGQVNPQQLQSMRQLTPETALLLRTILANSSDYRPVHNNSDNTPVDIFPDELEPGLSYVEGAKKRVLVNAYERDSRARLVCLNPYGYNCAFCDFNFESIYGERGKEYIHVHHLNPLALTNGQYELDPVKDLRPVCPNCHSMLHRGKQLLSIQQLKGILIKKK